MAAGKGRKLVIVESPAKARTIAGYLGGDYDVEASVGHIRDLPNPSELPADMKKGPFGRFAVDVDNGFEAYYVVDPDKRKKVAELRRLLKDADELYLATDEDREGEAIAWHLLETLKPRVPVKRMVFHEITREAIQRAAADTRELDSRLVDAQETRRILDRLYGYEVSPVLWRKVRQGLSAGRVQSVATRMVVERERERMAFTAASYWDVEAEVTPTSSREPFTARLTGVEGRRVATGRDFGDDGRLSSSAVHVDQARAVAIAAALPASTVTVTDVQHKPYTRRPAAPFTTSTLQQEASRKLRMSSKNAMRVAQRLYENGYITYMRTDSVTLSDAALTAARSQARDLYGAEYVADTPRRYTAKVKNAQEAHEAVRPAGDRFRTPAQVAGELRGEDFALYELIWKRTVASQMTDARGSTATVRLGATLEGGASTVEPWASGASTVEPWASGASTVELSASGTVITFRGFLAAYEEGQDEDRIARAREEEQERRLPALSVGVAIEVLRAEADGHETSPPPRFTEATLVKAMEEKGIGRPSTYAATVGTIQDRGYVRTRGSALVPTWLAFAVTRLLEEHFTELVDYDFTASMEEDLDRIAGGEEHRVAWLQRFYFGDEATSVEGLRHLVDDLGEIDARDISTIPLGDGMVVRVGRYGPYVEEVLGGAAGDGSASNEAGGSGGQDTPRRATITDDTAPDELTPAKARELLEQAGDEGRVLGVDPASGNEIVARAGRYGPYVTEVLPEQQSPASQPASVTDAAEAPAQDASPPATKPKAKTAKASKAAKAKPRTASLFTDMDLASIDLPTALRLLSLPRVVGADADGVEITAQNGRYGPYLKKGTDSRSLQTEQQLFDITLEEALAIYAQPKTRGGRAAAAPLRELGEDPVSGRPVVVKDGRFGPYVTDGEINATLRKGDDPASITPQRGFELLADKRASGPSPRKRAAKKTAAAKTAGAAKSPSATKTAARRTGAAKSAAPTRRAGAAEPSAGAASDPA
ncbi:MAG: type I DNA topoisomerase [Dermatophilaceae bacterium]